MATTVRPQAWYRSCFRQRILDLDPASVLDVGCGDGALLAFLQQNGVEAAGVEPDEARVSTLKQNGFRAEKAAAEALPFADNAFDIVVSEFSAHHFTSLSAHLAEACRVARKAVMALDQYYDLTIPSQRAASDLDKLCKKYDREAGMIHHDAYSGGDFVSALPPRSDWRAEVGTLLRLLPLADAKLVEIKSDAVARAREKERATTAFADLRRRHRACGFSDDGALIFIAQRESPA